MLYKPNDDAIGNHLELFGYEGWPELQDRDPWEEIPSVDEHEDRDND